MRKELSLEINKRCNFACEFCYTHKYHEDLPHLDEVYRVIDESIGEGVGSISLTGGEPLLQLDRVVGIAQYSKARRLNVRLNTNGYHLSDDVRDKLTPIVDEFQISFNAIGDEPFAHYAKISPRLRPYTTILENVKALKRAGQQVTIRFTLDLETGPFLQAVYKLFAVDKPDSSGCRVDAFKVRVVVPAGTIQSTRDSQDIIVPVTQGFFDLVRRNPGVPVTFKDGSGRISVPQDIPHVTTPACICGDGSLHVSCDLKRVTPCVFVRDMPEFSLGELRTGTQSLSEVWSSPKISQFLRHKLKPADSDVTCAAHILTEA